MALFTPFYRRFQSTCDPFFIEVNQYELNQ